jgi:hypothetical protein
MNRGLPVGNKYLNKKWKLKEQEIHQKKLKEMKGLIDLNPP